MADGSPETDLSDEELPDDDIRQLLEETALQRRWDGLKFLAAGAGGFLLSWLIFWLVGPVDELGDVERIVVLVLGYGSLLLGILSSLSGVALLINSFSVEP